jgi:hypothetical protein
MNIVAMPEHRSEDDLSTEEEGSKGAGSGQDEYKDEDASAVSEVKNEGSEGSGSSRELIKRNDGRQCPRCARRHG